MDQLRSILGWLKKQHFWVLCVLVGLIGVFSWWRASGALSVKYDTDQRKITGEFQNLTSLRNSPFHPNADINTRQIDETKKLADEVGKLWQQLYDRQSEGVLKWPDALNQAFHEEIEKLQFGQEIPGNLREHYQNYIARHFPKLPEKIGARPIDPDLAGNAAGGGFGRMERGPVMAERPMAIGPDGRPIEEDDNYICEWLEQDQANVAKELEFQQQPSSLQIWAAQENLWVYHTLLNVIKNTNDAAKATRRSNAAVRTLFALQVGQPAAQFSRTPNRIYKLATAAPTAEAIPLDGSVDGGEASSGIAMPGGPMPAGIDRGMSGLAFSGSGPMTDAQRATVLLSGRYLDEMGKPIPFGGAASADGTAPDPSIPAPVVDRSFFGKEYVRVPVRMVLEMDQRRLPQLIAECANQPLQVEVQEVRVNVADAISGAESGMFAFRGGGFDSSGGGSLFPTLSGLQEFKKDPHIASVVIQGVIYIFNKPNQELLNTEGSGEALAQTPAM
jgi:hypothetical protein